MKSKSLGLLFISCLVLGCHSEKQRSENSIPNAHTINDDSGDKNTYVLEGTTVLSSSERNIEARWGYGFFLEKLESSNCNQPATESPPPIEITSVKMINDSTLVVLANVYANCSHKFLGEIEITEENTLNLVYHGYGGYANCGCCFGLTYTINIFRDDDKSYTKVKYVTIDGYNKKKLPPI